MSAALVTPFQPGDAGPLQSVLDLGVRQLGQALLSALWAIVGVAALVSGLRRDVRELRLTALDCYSSRSARSFCMTSPR
ncbi:hypothetical protein BH20ACT17_BH20ACT17_02770 [soil metagenome]